MQCPKCRAVMEQVEYENIQVDRCTKCQGLWFDLREEEQLQGIEGAESIDTGDEFVGAQFDKLRQINCPHCDTAMKEMRADTDIAIQYEYCPKCQGAFFDAGEFTAYLEDVIVDRFRQYNENRRW